MFKKQNNLEYVIKPKYYITKYMNKHATVTFHAFCFQRLSLSKYVF